MAEIHVCIGCGKRDTSSRSMVCIECQTNRNDHAQARRDRRAPSAEDCGYDSQLKDDRRRGLYGPAEEDPMEIEDD